MIDADKLKKELAPYEENDFSQQKFWMLIPEVE